MFAWMGEATGRLRTGIRKVFPRELYLIIESKNDEWRKFHSEIANSIADEFGKLIAVERIMFEDDVKGQEFYGRIVFRVCSELRKIKSHHDSVVVVFDLTAAPSLAHQMLLLVGSLLSDERCKVIVQHVSRKQENLPIYHAPLRSRYYDEHKNRWKRVSNMTLAEYNQMEAEDEGDGVSQIPCLSLRFNLLDDSAEDIPMKLARQLLFLKLPSVVQRQERTDEIRGRMYDENLGREIVFGAAKDRSTTKDKSEEDWAHSVDVWVSTTLNSLSDLGLVEKERIGKHLFAKRTPTGDIFVDAVDDLYKELKKSWSESRGPGHAPESNDHHHIF